MVDVQRPGSTHAAQQQQQQQHTATPASAASSAPPATNSSRSTAMRTATPSPSTSSASSIHGDDNYGGQYRSSLKDDDMTEGEESLYGGSISSPYFYGQQSGGTPNPQQQQRDEEELFASYTSTPQQELDDQMRTSTWDYYYPPVSNTPAATSAPPSSSTAPSVPTGAGSAPKQMSRHPQQLPSRFPQDPQNPHSNPQPNLSGLRYPAATSAFPASSLSTTMSTANSGSSSSNVINRQGVKRPLERVAASSPMASPTVSIASSMIAMRNIPDALDLSRTTNKALLAHPSVTKTASSAFTSNTINISTNSINLSASSAAPITSSTTMVTTKVSSARKVKKETADEDDPDALLGPAAKKTKVSRERQLKINAASRRCRKKQKLELQFLRTHVVDLQNALKEQVSQLAAVPGQQIRAARLGQFLDDSIHKVEEMSSGGRPTTPANSNGKALGGAESDAFKSKSGDERSGDDTDGLSAGSDRVSKIEVDDVRGVHAIDPMTGYFLSDERKKTLLNIASFVRVNMSLESRSFSPEVISCLPIEMDGWQLRLSITEKNYTIHNCKFFPCNLVDMYDFCWETNVSQKISIKQGKKHYSVVTPLDKDVAHVYSKTIGKWSLSVHGVPNVSYNSLVCRRYEPDQHRAIICQQSVLEERDFEDESTLPWLFKRWVVFQPHVVDGVQGTLVEAFRTASYATGKLIYKENNTYDSFCEHLIRRYAESNSLLERMMARDKRFQHVAAIDVGIVSELDIDYEETASDRMVKDLLLF